MNGPSAEFGTLNPAGGLNGGLSVPVVGSSYRKIPEGQITFSVPLSGRGGGTTGFVDVRVRALGTAPLASFNLGLNQQLIGRPNDRVDKTSVSVNANPLTVGIGENGVVVGGSAGLNARFPLNSKGASDISARAHGAVNYLNGATGAEATLQARVRIGELPGFGDLNFLGGVTAGVAIGQNPSAIVFFGVQSGGGASKPAPYEVVTETKIVTPNTIKQTAIGNVVLNNPGQQENLKPGAPTNNLTPVDSESRPLFTVQRREESTSTVNDVAYSYRFAYDANPLDNKPGIKAEFFSNLQLDAASVDRLRKAVREASALGTIYEIGKFLSRKGFTNLEALPTNPQVNQAIEKYREVTNPANFREVETNLGTIFISQDGETVRINKSELSLLRRQNPTLEERMGVFNRSTPVTDRRELQMYREIVRRSFEEYRLLNGQYPQPSGIPLQDGTNGRLPTDLRIRP